jgi:mevalonate kinase
MASLLLSVPGKSFMAGEYLAVKGGPSLVFTSRPRFQLKVTPGTGTVTGIHPDSPAGQLIRDHQSYFKNHDLEFVDPHGGRGGWGASTAQFLMAFVVNEWRDSCELETLKSLSISRLLDHYWQYAWNGQGVRPSGADLVAQYKGSLTLFDRESGLIDVFKWPFADIDFALIPTGQKLATHEHLRKLPDFDASSLLASVKSLQEALRVGDDAGFVAGIRAAGAGLSALGFVAEKTAALLTGLQTSPAVLAAKGCGALGADVVLIVYRVKDRAAIVDHVRAQGLAIAATSEELSHGLEIQVRSSL